ECRTLLGLETEPATAGYVVVMQVGTRRFGLLVDRVLETEEIVVKPMSSKLRHISLFCGNTILGDGAIVLILDPNGIARQIGPDMLSAASDLSLEARGAADAADTMALLVYRSGTSGLKAIPLPLVTRLEEVDAGRIEWIGERPCLQYQGRLMPLVMGAEATRRTGAQPLIVFSESGRSVGLVVDEIVDIVEEIVTIEPVPGRPDLVGSAIVRGRATEIVDIAAIIPWIAGKPGQHGGQHRGAAIRTVLLVDDNAFFRDMLTPVLRAAGYKVRVAGTADEALKIVATHSVDAVVTDLDMPGRSGLQLIEDVRRDPRLAPMTVVALASSAPNAVLDRARDLGVFEVVAKFDRSGLLAALAEALLQLDRAA
ncbi:MAG TPA: chemotaxis protein CheW, partial [Enterovirga sp.]|nr:chemotaxis protein CheW [Enterovirga sp.]